MKNGHSIKFRMVPDGQTLTANGRDGWALQEFVKAGGRGGTATDVPGPRWASYVHHLRAMGLAIETIHEAHGGPFPGNHARYCRRSAAILEGQQ